MATLLFSVLAATQASAWAGPIGVPDPMFLVEPHDMLDALNAERSAPTPDSPEDAVRSRVLEILKNSQVPVEFVEKSFSDPATRVLPSIAGFFARPAEGLPYARYKKRLVDPARVKRGRDFLDKHRELLDSIEKRTGLDSSVVAAVVGLETNYGTDRGRYSVFNALYSAAHTVPKRAKWATNELAELLKLAHKQGIGAHSIKGSYAGAFGHFQFIPSSFNAYAVDFDGDGRIDPQAWPDVLGSVAEYLLRNGYRPGETDFSEAGSVWKAIYAYNHSQNYVKAVLELRAAVAAEPAAR